MILLMNTETLLDKNQVIDSFQNLPDQVSVDELIERILFIQLINERVRSAEAGNIVPHDQVMRELNELRARKQAERRDSRA